MKLTKGQRPPTTFAENPYSNLGNEIIYNGMPPIDENLPLAGSILLALRGVKCEYSLVENESVVAFLGTQYKKSKPIKTLVRTYFYSRKEDYFTILIEKKENFFDLSFLGKLIFSHEFGNFQYIPLTWQFISKLKPSELLIIWNDLNLK